MESGEPVYIPKLPGFRCAASGLRLLKSDGAIEIKLKGGIINPKLTDIR